MTYRDWLNKSEVPGRYFDLSAFPLQIDQRVIRGLRKRNL
jgi:hypothetical protein